MAKVDRIKIQEQVHLTSPVLDLEFGYFLRPWDQGVFVFEIKNRQSKLAAIMRSISDYPIVWHVVKFRGSALQPRHLTTKSPDDGI